MDVNNLIASWLHFFCAVIMVILFWGCLSMPNRSRMPDRVFLNLWNSAIAALSVGSIFEGVLVIFGTTNSLIVVYQIVIGFSRYVIERTLVRFVEKEFLFRYRVREKESVISRFDSLKIRECLQI